MKLVNKNFIELNDNSLILIPLLFILLILSTSAFAYDRREWKHWTDEDHNCKNTRAEVLVKYNIGTIEYTSKKQCTVKTGEWKDFYFPETLTEAKDIDIDHVIPLKYVDGLLNKMGVKWDSQQKQTFANDFDNLIVTNKSYNRQKGAKSILEWLPVGRQYACRYIKRWMLVKKKYSLLISKEEYESEKLTCK